MRHAGMHWPANANGEHPDRGTIYALPGVEDGCLLMLADSARYWYEEARAHAQTVVWRGLPRPNKLPAMLKWNAKRVADEVLNLWDEQRHDGTEYFQPLNELQFLKESGEDWIGYGPMARRLANLRQELRRRLPPSVWLVFPPWVPGDDLANIGDWAFEAVQWDVIGLHAYDSADSIRARYYEYRQQFPTHHIFIGEWNANHGGHDEEQALVALAEIADRDPLFLGATYYIWETNNEGEHDLSVWGNGRRLALFQDPPRTPSVVPPPVEPPKEEPVLEEVNAWEFWDARTIAAAADVPLAMVEETWPHVVPQLALCGVNTKKIQIAVIGTMAHETASQFKPVLEAFWLLGPNGEETPAWQAATARYGGYPGTGDVQLTWLNNFQRYNAKLEGLWGVGSPNIVLNPRLALDQDVAAAVIGLWFRDERALPTPSWPQGYSLQDACDLDDDEWIRILVYGAADPIGQARIATVRAALTGQVTPAVLVYDPNTPPQRQIQNWVCAIRAATWALLSLGINVTAAQMQDEMVPGTVTPAKGLLDGRGYGLASTLGRHLPSGTKIEVVENPDWDAVWNRAGNGPICLGSGNPEMYHWINIAKQLPDGTLSAPNPAPNHPSPLPIGDVLDRGEFDRYYGSWNMVHVDLGIYEVIPAEPNRPGSPDLNTLVGVAYHNDGVVLPVLADAIREQDWGKVEAAAKFLRDNNPDK